MKKILLGFSVLLMTLVSAQNYPDYYPNNNNGYGNNNNNGYGNNNYYGDVDDEFYFPDDYYYEYPADYYNNDLYQGYYNDYRQSIRDVNWNRFFASQRLSPWQMQQIMLLNDNFSSYSAWNSFYRYNPDRWYYDRFYAMQRILGPSLFIVFQNNFYNGYNPVVYYQNYNHRHYARNVYVIPRYRYTNINVYKVNKVQYHQNNPRQDIGFRSTPRAGQTANLNANRETGFRNDGARTDNSTRNNSFRTEKQGQRNAGTRTENAGTRNSGTRTENTGTRNTDFRTRAQAPTNDRLRNEPSQRQEIQRNVAPTRKVESSPRTRSNQNTESRTPSSSSRNSGLRFTTR